MDSNVPVTVVLRDLDTELLVAQILMSVDVKLMIAMLTLAALILPEGTNVTATMFLPEMVSLVMISMSALMETMEDATKSVRILWALETVLVMQGLC